MPSLLFQSELKTNPSYAFLRSSTQVLWDCSTSTLLPFLQGNTCARLRLMDPRCIRRVGSKFSVSNINAGKEREKKPLGEPKGVKVKIDLIGHRVLRDENVSLLYSCISFQQNKSSTNPVAPASNLFIVQHKHSQISDWRTDSEKGKMGGCFTASPLNISDCELFILGERKVPEKAQHYLLIDSNRLSTWLTSTFPWYYHQMGYQIYLQGY